VRKAIPRARAPRWHGVMSDGERPHLLAQRGIEVVRERAALATLLQGTGAHLDVRAPDGMKPARCYAVDL
jgi:hypothetical protein